MATATAGSPAAAASTPSSPNDVFLKYAPSRSISITGTITNGVSGGPSNSLTTWASPVPETPVWCDAVDFQVNAQFAIVVSAAGTFTISPYAPYCGFSIGFKIAGAAPWVLNEATPFLLDNIRRTRDFDPAFLGLGGNTGFFGKNSVIDTGSFGPNYTTATIAPGATTTNSGTAQATFTLNWQFTIHVQLQQLSSQTWGMIPFGDPKNRIETIFMLNPIVGTTPEQSFVSASTGTVTATISATLNVNAVYKVRDIDVLPDGINPPTVTVGLGYTLNFTTISLTTAGVVKSIEHTDAIAYTAIDHILVNNQIPIRPDYMGLWLTQEQKSARWAYDSQDNTLGDYWEDYKRKQHRYPYYGHFQVDLARGGFPDLPGVSPYDAIMSPDDTYAAMFGVKPTPLMQTAIRIASGTSLTNAYVRVYEFGLTKISY